MPSITGVALSQGSLMRPPFGLVATDAYAHGVDGIVFYLVGWSWSWKTGNPRWVQRSLWRPHRIRCGSSCKAWRPLQGSPQQWCQLRDRSTEQRRWSRPYLARARHMKNGRKCKISLKTHSPNQSQCIARPPPKKGLVTNKGHTERAKSLFQFP